MTEKGDRLALSDTLRGEEKFLLMTSCSAYSIFVVSLTCTESLY